MHRTLKTLDRSDGEVPETPEEAILRGCAYDTSREDLVEELTRFAKRSSIRLGLPLAADPEEVYAALSALHGEGGLLRAAPSADGMAVVGAGPPGAGKSAVLALMDQSVRGNWRLPIRGGRSGGPH